MTLYGCETWTVKKNRAEDTRHTRNAVLVTEKYLRFRGATESNKLRLIKEKRQLKKKKK